MVKWSNITVRCIGANLLTIWLALWSFSPIIARARGLPTNKLWSPERRSRDDWLACRGLPCDKWEAVVNATTLIQKLEREDSDLKSMKNSVTQMPGLADVLFTPEQAEAMLAQLIESRDHNEVRKHTRRKRKVITTLTKLWGLPIIYKFDDSQSPGQRAIIREAIKHIEARTCIPFFEVNTHALLPAPHIIFIGHWAGCLSYIGRIQLEVGEPQMISLPIYCMDGLGTAVHEILHTLGVWHEHQRPDRDAYVTIKTENVSPYYTMNFEKSPSDDVDIHSLPYDFSSVMHYASEIGSLNGERTLDTKDPYYFGNVGQRLELSFLDSKLLNQAYCKNSCNVYPGISCQNGGYQDPKDCYNCRCQEGLGGTDCTEVAPPIGSECGGKIVLPPGEWAKLTSPGYVTQDEYPEDVQCSWLIETSPNANIEIIFNEDFGVANIDARDTCYNWLGLSLGLDNPGYRFCGDQKPKGTFISESNKMLLTLKSRQIPPYKFTAERRGFQAVVMATAIPETTMSLEETTSQPVAATTMSTSTSTSNQNGVTTPRNDLTLTKEIFTTAAPSSVASKNRYCHLGALVVMWVLGPVWLWVL